MLQSRILELLIAGVLVAVGTYFASSLLREDRDVPADREVVVFWHFWGGKDAEVVADVVNRFNDSQEQYFVRAIAMPGNNLNAKLFLSITGGDPPDLINQDDPVVADWAARGAIESFDSFVDENELAAVKQWMYPSARKLCDYDNRTYAICNGLDIRALYYNKTELDRLGFKPPATIDELDTIANRVAPFEDKGKRENYAYLPDSRRLQAWGYVFGGNFVNRSNGDATIDTEPNAKALDWMVSYARHYGPNNVAAFRAGDQSLPGKTFPLLPIEDEQTLGRYLFLMDGQWRTRDIAAFQQRRRDEDLPLVEFGVCPLPCPEGGRKNAGWVNGNFFVIPNGAKNKPGAWEFAKFWIGYQNENDAAQTCSAGGWIPVSPAVTNDRNFQQFLDEQPLFKSFVELAASDNQFPTPRVVGAAYFDRTLKTMTAKAMNEPNTDARQWLEDTDMRVQQFFDRARRSYE